MHLSSIAGAAAIVFSFSVAACAAGGAGAESGTASASRADDATLTSEEIRGADLPNAYELVSRLRRAWLRDDGVTGRAVRIYMDNRDIGDASALRQIPAVDVRSMQYLSNDAAVARWGGAVEGSVIVITRA